MDFFAGLIVGSLLSSGSREEGWTMEMPIDPEDRNPFSEEYKEDKIGDQDGNNERN